MALIDPIPDDYWVVEDNIQEQPEVLRFLYMDYLQFRPVIRRKVLDPMGIPYDDLTNFPVLDPGQVNIMVDRMRQSFDTLKGYINWMNGLQGIIHLKGYLKGLPHLDTPAQRAAVGPITEEKAFAVFLIHRIYMKWSLIDIHRELEVQWDQYEHLITQLTRTLRSNVMTPASLDAQWIVNDMRIFLINALFHLRNAVQWLYFCGYIPPPNYGPLPPPGHYLRAPYDEIPWDDHPSYREIEESPFVGPAVGPGAGPNQEYE